MKHNQQQQTNQINRQQKISKKKIKQAEHITKSIHIPVYKTDHSKSVVFVSVFSSPYTFPQHCGA
jgi:hypothetical protein